MKTQFLGKNFLDKKLEDASEDMGETTNNLSLKISCEACGSHAMALYYQMGCLVVRGTSCRGLDLYIPVSDYRGEFVVNDSPLTH